MLASSSLQNRRKIVKQNSSFLDANEKNIVNLFPRDCQATSQPYFLKDFSIILFALSMAIVSNEAR